MVEESIYQLNRDGQSIPGEITQMDSASQVGARLGGMQLAQLPGNNMGMQEESKDTESIYSYRTGVSQASAITYATDMLGLTANTTFLLLDLRDPDEYDMWRIKEAINFPCANIARDKTIPELFRFKNQPDKLIVTYMNDERQGVQYAQLLSEKGYENTFLLSGGIESFLEDFTDLVEGRNVPVPKRQVAEAEAQKLAEKKAYRQEKKQQMMTKF